MIVNDDEKGKKIGILTFHNAHNYGAVMQAYALMNYLKNLGHDVKILNYVNEQIASNYVKEGKFEDNLKQKKWNEQHDRFEEFIINEILYGKCDQVTVEQLKKSEYDAFICGSDQIWNSGLTGGIDPVYFLDFDTDAKKIAYAPSKFKSWIKEEEKSYFIFALNKLDNISTREKSLSDELEKLTGRDIETVMDPVFLLTSNQYVKVMGNTYDIEDFILVYYLAEDEKLYNYSKQIQEQLGLKIVEIHFFEPEKNENIQFSNCGPREFIELFYKCSYVVTNSFHGTAFSVIFRKNFIAVYENDNRKEQLLNKLGLTSRRFYTQKVEKNELIVDYSHTELLLNECIEHSERFIKESLK